MCRGLMGGHPFCTLARSARNRILRFQLQRSASAIPTGRNWGGPCTFAKEGARWLRHEPREPSGGQSRERRAAVITSTSKSGRVGSSRYFVRRTWEDLAAFSAWRACEAAARGIPRNGSSEKTRLTSSAGTSSRIRMAHGWSWRVWDRLPPTGMPIGSRLNLAQLFRSERSPRHPRGGRDGRTSGSPKQRGGDGADRGRPPGGVRASAGKGPGAASE
jgi:hypothetical protein